MSGSVQNVLRLELLPLLVRHHLPPRRGALRGTSRLRGELVGLSVRAAVWLYVGSVDSGQRRPRGDALCQAGGVVGTHRCRIFFLPRCRSCE